MANKEKNNIDRERLCYNLLCKVFIDGAYSQIELNTALKEVEPQARAYITRIFYGVIEKSIQFDQIIADLTQKPPQRQVAIIAKIGLFLLRCTNTPPYAAIDKTVNLIKSTPKRALSGFINAFLKKSIDYRLPQQLFVQLSCPQWLVKRLQKRYDDEFIGQLLCKNDGAKIHIRPNLNKILVQEFEQTLQKFDRSALGYFVEYDCLRRLKPHEYVVQSLSSTLAVESYLSNEEFTSVLDLCGAPGGKSIYLKQLSPSTEVICCDVHAHRVELIKKYAGKYGAQIGCKLNDATVENPAWQEKFDLVVCDVPCSGFGVKGKPDIFINRSEEDIALLCDLQLKILSTAKKYVKKGGILCYSTCTVLKEENEDIIAQFLAQNPQFKVAPILSKAIKSEGAFNIYPQQFFSDAFFVCRLRRE